MRYTNGHLYFTLIYTYNGRPLDRCDLSNGAIFKELERPLCPVSRLRHSLTLNISETVRDTVSIAFLKALSLHWFCSTCTPTTCQLHVAENSFTLTTYVSPFNVSPFTSANWNAVSRRIWRGCHTSVDSGDLNQAPPKQSAVYSACIIPAPPVNCQFIWMASAFSMSATHPILR